MEVALRVDAGFAREPPMAWRQTDGVEYLFGLARQAAPPLQGVHLAHAEQLEPPPAGRRQSRWTHGKANPQNIAQAIMQGPPKDGWDYMKREGKPDDGE